MIKALLFSSELEMSSSNIFFVFQGKKEIQNNMKVSK